MFIDNISRGYNIFLFINIDTNYINKSNIFFLQYISLNSK